MMSSDSDEPQEKEDGEVNARVIIAKRAAAEIHPNTYVNLGIGMPTLTPNFVDPQYNVYFHSENGLLGTGEYPLPG